MSDSCTAMLIEKYGQRHIFIFSSSIVTRRLYGIFIGVVDFIPATNEQVHLLSYPVCKYYEGSVVWGETMTFTCDQLVSGRYLIIQANNLESLILCDVEVYGGTYILTVFLSNFSNVDMSVILALVERVAHEPRIEYNFNLFLLDLGYQSLSFFHPFKPMDTNELCASVPPDNSLIQMASLKRSCIVRNVKVSNTF